jgi:hypothetical protein
MTNAEAMQYLLTGMQVRRAQIEQTLQDLHSQLNDHLPAIVREPSWPELAREELKNIAARQAATRARRGDPPSTPPKRHTMSAAGRRAVQKAQRERWARVKAEQSEQAAAAAKPKRRLSAAGRRAISQAAKARWAREKWAREKAMAAAG